MPGAGERTAEFITARMVPLRQPTSPTAAERGNLAPGGLIAVSDPHDHMDTPTPGPRRRSRSTRGSILDGEVFSR
jgi:hypothetical protein